MIKYIPEVCPDTNNCGHGCIHLNSDTKYICDHWDVSVMDRHDELVKEKIKLIKKWNKSIKSIPQIDEYRLRKIKMWRVFLFKLIPDFYADNFSVYKLKSEARLLINRGFNLGFSEDIGTGHIVKSKNNKFDIELWDYKGKSNPINNASLNDVLNWIIHFCDSY